MVSFVKALLKKATASNSNLPTGVTSPSSLSSSSPVSAVNKKETSTNKKNRKKSKSTKVNHKNVQATPNTIDNGGGGGGGGGVDDDGLSTPLINLSLSSITGSASNSQSTLAYNNALPQQLHYVTHFDNPLEEDQYEDEEEQVDEQQEDETENDEDGNFEAAFEFEGVSSSRDDTDFSCLSPGQIVEAQDSEIKSVADLFSLPHHVSALLLRHFQWKKEKLIQRMLENSDQVYKEAGITSDGAANTHISKAIQLVGDDMCSICAEDMPASECTALSCAHRFCNSCWREYLAMKIKEGEVTKLKCPHMKCNLIVDETAVKKLVDSITYERYIRFITKAFVEDSDGKIKWCPQPHCGNAITADMITGTVVRCSCGHRFCFSCHREAHAPATCPQVKEWEKKCKDDSETTHWKYANTKDCPKCETAVEKNGGCNHMTCRQCKHEWCWVCMKPWKGHNDYYNCNKFSKKDKPSKASWFSLRSSKKDKAREKEEERERNRVALERYLHYFTRYVNHSHSSELEKQIRTRAATKMNELQKHASTISEVQYVEEGTEILLECRNVLKWTYVVAYYLPESGPEKELFEYLQEDLEKTTESLSEMLETNDSTQDHRLKALNMIQLSRTRKDNLLRGVEQGLTEEFRQTHSANS